VLALYFCTQKNYFGKGKFGELAKLTLGLQEVWNFPQLSLEFLIFSLLFEKWDFGGQTAVKIQNTSPTLFWVPQKLFLQPSI
jgi:hypothetical protein